MPKLRRGWETAWTRVTPWLILWVTFLAVSTPSRAQSIPFRAGTEVVGGQRVPVYSNPGAVHYRRTIKISRGIISIRRPKILPRKPKLKHMPTVYTFRESAHQTLGPHIITVYRTIGRLNGHAVRKPTRVNISPIIVREARKNNIDPLLIEIVIKHESNFKPYATSRAGAKGLMQLMPGTALRLGVHDIFDPAENIRGGTQYLAEQLIKFRNLGLALAAYNAGPGSVKQYKGIPPFAETRRYVYSIASEYASKRKKRRRLSWSKTKGQASD